ncbi:tyrosine-type recombinase/integrase [Nocardia barduliensis]|uniref:tyrosine-type recombinase/integrase n=1 Tax=Nocardia barduliensis TaxID=2736643 RepID=UPI001574B74D|nr:tyrosine-type recombinase/integrase [Nocardia barduliensis]
MNRRRNNGEGSVYQRKDGRWEGAAYLGTVNGKVRRLRVYGHTRAEARGKLTARIADSERGIPIPDRSWKIGDYLDYWMGTTTKLRPSTRELYETAIRLHLKPMAGSYSLEGLTVPMLQQLLNQELASGKSVRTVRLIRTILSAALTRAMREELVTRNVARLVELEQSHRKEIILWTVEEGSRFLKHAQSHPLFAAFLMLGLYGMRRGEVLGLRWTDIDWDRGVIRIRQQLQQIGNHLEVGPVKTNAGQRDLPLLAVVREALSQHRAHQLQNLLSIDSGVDEGVLIGATTHHDSDASMVHPATSGDPQDHNEFGDLILLSENGTPLWPRNFVRAFHRLCKQAGVRRIKLHHLRHGAATFLKNTGVPARDVQLILGHAHISTTLQIYQHGDLDTQQSALDRIGRALMQPSAAVVNSDSSRQTLPSNEYFVDESTSIISGGTSGFRTHDTLLKSITRLGRDPALTTVITRLRTRANTHILGCVAVKSCRQDDQTYNAETLVLCEWFPLRDALTPIVTPFTNPPTHTDFDQEVSDGPTNPAEPSQHR